MVCGVTVKRKMSSMRTHSNKERTGRIVTFELTASRNSVRHRERTYTLIVREKYAFIFGGAKLELQKCWVFRVAARLATERSVCPRTAPTSAAYLSCPIYVQTPRTNGLVYCGLRGAFNRAIHLKFATDPPEACGDGPDNEYSDTTPSCCVCQQFC